MEKDMTRPQSVNFLASAVIFARRDKGLVQLQALLLSNLASFLFGGQPFHWDAEASTPFAKS